MQNFFGWEKQNTTNKKIPFVVGPPNTQQEPEGKRSAKEMRRTTRWRRPWGRGRRGGEAAAAGYTISMNSSHTDPLEANPQGITQTKTPHCTGKGALRMGIVFFLQILVSMSRSL